jgi:hypothetical protein
MELCDAYTLHLLIAGGVVWSLPGVVQAEGYVRGANGTGA